MTHGISGDKKTWAPAWFWTVGVSLSLVAFAFTAPGIAFHAAGGALSGAISGVIGGLIGLAFNLVLQKQTRLPQILLNMGVVLGIVFEQATGLFVSLLLDHEVVRFIATMAFLGGIVGAVLGILPQYIYRSRNRRDGNKYWWICLGAGLVGGGALALPVVVVLTVMKVQGRDYEAKQEP